MPDETKMVRTKLFVDHKVQGALVGRALLYWFMCLLTVVLMLLCWQILTGPARLFYTHVEEMWFHFGPAVVASVLLLPLIVIDIIRLSNRFAGPLVRLRRSLRALAAGQPVERIHFRKEDFWREFAEEFNAVLARVEAAERQATDLARRQDDEADQLVTV